ncbi:hypothetical protein EV697_104165 [Bisgaardia hudsonensis]|uniref:UPF0149 protein EV697_104165 n=1 Tax=Bisgaardia hudsonensis TaxID=109472 RepID=A0A4R2MXU8_9PAST|nr:YecA family protein [Bisgaardia hudsonensis]QLB12308.1 hypothetical protein A6A11_01085 [Bisgaardia hudsonensis]TCP12354.1 hypothetical protein EV697_104165 [Bisgaardia hudsonensis]
MTDQLISYSQLNTQLKQANIGVTAFELQGLLTGFICGGVADQHWQTLMYQLTNDNHAYPTALLNEITALYQHTKQLLADIDGFNFEIWLPETDVFERADALSEWTNHFILGLGLNQPQLDKEKGEIGEALDDLQDIAQLGYDEDDNKEELSHALEEIIEYVRTITALLYTHFNPQRNQQEQKTVLH